MGKDNNLVTSKVQSKEKNAKEEGKVKAFFKNHKKAIIAGTAIVVVIGGGVFLYEYDNGKIIKEVINAIKPLKKKPIIPSETTQVNEIIEVVSETVEKPVSLVEPVIKSVRAPYSNPFEVSGGLVNLPQNYHPSKEAIYNALINGYVLDPNGNITYRRTFTKGLNLSAA